MKKKFLSLTLAIGLLATAAIGGTLAYFTDTDADVNVMTTGNVKIVQNERDRGGSDITMGISDGVKLIPAVYNGTLSYDGIAYTGTNIWADTVDNEVDKIITVTNNGSEAAYVRTILAFQDQKLSDGSYLTEKIHTLWNASAAVNSVDGVDWIMDGTDYAMINKDGVNYTLCVFTYAKPVAAGATTEPSLVQLFLDPSADNDWSEAAGANYNILTLSQAVQAAGFDSATEALNAGFGEVTKDNCWNWFKDL